MIYWPFNPLSQNSAYSNVHKCTCNLVLGSVLHEWGHTAKLTRPFLTFTMRNHREANQIITTKVVFYKNTIPEETILMKTKDTHNVHPLHMWTTHVPFHLLCTDLTQTQRLIPQLRETPQWKLQTASASFSPSLYITTLHNLTHTPVTHVLLIQDRGFLQHSTMGSSPDCYRKALTISQPLFWQEMCWTFFCPYHMQTSFFRRGHMPSSPIKQSHAKGQSRVYFPFGDPITHYSFTFKKFLNFFSYGNSK